MSPSRKHRAPTFDLPPASNEGEPTGWTYRSDAPRTAFSRLESPAERFIAAIARPFEVAFAILLVPFGKSGRPLAVLLIAASVLAVSTTSCRRNEVNWTGVEAMDRGDTLQLASEEPQCSCLTLTNAGSEPVTVRARLHATNVGAATIPPGGHITELFDWAGETNSDVYELTAVKPTGHPVKFGETIKFAHSGWAECSTIGCKAETLKMDVALTAGH